MKRIIFLFLVLVCGCVNLLPSKDGNPEFVDKRFNHKFISHLAHPWDAYLTPYTYVMENRLGTYYIYYDCELLENKIRFVKMECQRVRYVGGLNEDLPWHRQLTFEISSYKDWLSDEYRVKVTQYSSIKNDDIWSRSGGYVYTILDGKESN